MAKGRKNVDSARSRSHASFRNTFPVGWCSQAKENFAHQPVVAAEGMDLSFVDHPPEDLTCPICLHVHREPVLTSCCGNHFCLSCVEQVRHEQRPCPLCNAKNFTTMLDKYFARKVNELQVWCQHRKMGCPWQGSVSDLERHLDCTSGNCEFMRIDCPYFCGDSLNFYELESHKKLCPHRPYLCKFCGYNGTYEGMCTKHWSVCDKYPVPCTNNCGRLDIPREALSKHLQEECSLNEKKCEFAYAGCTANLKNSDMSEHIASSLQEHLHLVSRHCFRLSESLPSEFRSQMEEEMKSKDHKIVFLQSKLKESEDEMALLQAKVASLQDEIDDIKIDCFHLRSIVLVPPFEFIMTDFREHKKKQDQWLSPSFYSHIGGYRLCISVDASGSEEGQDTHVSVYVNLMKGEYDNNLQWPFKGSIFIALCNQRVVGVGNWEEKVMFTYDASEIASRVTEGMVAEQGLGIPTFIEHSRLGFDSKKNTEYLRGDCLRFKIMSVDLMNTANRRSTGSWAP